MGGGEAERARGAAQRRQALEHRAGPADDHLDHEVESDRDRAEEPGHQPGIALVRVGDRKDDPDREPDEPVLADPAEPLADRLDRRRRGTGSASRKAGGWSSRASTAAQDRRYGRENARRARAEPTSPTVSAWANTSAPSGGRGCRCSARTSPSGEDIFNRAAPLLGLVFLGELLGAGQPRLELVAERARGRGAGWRSCSVAIGSLNRARGRPFSAIPRRLGKAELAGFVLVPAVLPLLFGGQLGSAAVTAGANLLLLGLIYAVVGLGLISIVALGPRPRRQPASLRPEPGRQGSAAAGDLRPPLLPHPGAVGDLLPPHPGRSTQ